MDKKQPISESELTQIGTIGKPHGVKGEVELRLTVDYERLGLTSGSFVFLTLNALPVPHCIATLRTKGADRLLIAFERALSRDAAALLTGAELSVPSEQLTDEAVEFTWNHFVGFELLDQNDQTIGRIVDVDDSTVNILFDVMLDGRDDTVLLPVNDQLISYIDAPRHQIAVEVNHELLDL